MGVCLVKDLDRLRKAPDTATAFHLLHQHSA